MINKHPEIYEYNIIALKQRINLMEIHKKKLEQTKKKKFNYEKVVERVKKMHPLDHIKIFDKTQIKKESKGN